MSSYLLLLPIFKVFLTDEIFRRLAQLIDLLTSAFLALLPSWCCGKRQRQRTIYARHLHTKTDSHTCAESFGLPDQHSLVVGNGAVGSVRNHAWISSVAVVNPLVMS